MAGKRITIARDDGELGTIDESELERATASGFRVVDEAEAKAVEQRRDAQSNIGMAIGGGEALLRGATLGLSDVALRSAGVDMEGARLRRENLGTLGTATEFTGALAPGLLTGGTGTVASLARATPAALAARVGLAAERAVLGSGVRSRVLGSAAQGGVEGFLGGVGQGASDLALANKDLAAEQLMASGLGGLGTGVLVGGGLGAAGAGLEVTGALAQRAGAQLLDRTAGLRGALGERARSAGRRVLGAADTLAQNGADLTPYEWTFAQAGRWLGRIQGGNQDDYAKLFGGVASKKGRDRILADTGEVVETTARGIKDAADKMNAAYSDAIRLSGGVNKRARMASLAPDARPRQLGRFVRGPRSYALEHLDTTLQRLDEDLADDLISRETRADLLEVKRIYEVARRDADEVRTPDQAFMALDDAKRSADAVAARRYDQYENNKSPEAYKAWEKARSLTDSTRAHLEDATIYGDMASSQQRMNAAIAADMRALEVLPPHQQAFLAKGAVADSAVAMSLARKSTRFGGESQHAAFQAAIDARLNRLRVTRAETELDPEQLRRFDDAERAIEDMRARLDEASETAEVHDVMSKVRRDEGGGSPSLTMLSTFGPAAGAGLGFMVGGLPGALLGSVAGMAMRPFTLARGMAAGLNMLGNVNLAKYKGAIETVTSRVSGLSAGFDRLAEGGRAAVRTAAKAARRGAAATRTAALVTAPESRRQRQDRLIAVRDQVMAAAADPLAMADQLQDQLAELYGIDPALAETIVERSAVATQFLASKAPLVYQPEFGNARPIVPPEELDRFQRYVDAVSDPLGAAEKVLSGGLALEHAETLRVVYPKIYAELQDKALEMLGRRQQEGRRISEEALVELGLLLDMPLSDSLKPGFLGALQPTALAPGPGAPPAQPRGPKPIEVGGVRTELGRLEAGQLRA